jgi:hypothetical protein
MEQSAFAAPGQNEIPSVAEVDLLEKRPGIS